MVASADSEYPKVKMVLSALNLTNLHDVINQIFPRQARDTTSRITMPDADAVIEHLFPTLADVREKDANALEVAGPMSAEYHGETITVCNHVMGWVHGTFLFNFLLNAGLSVNITMTMLDMLIIHTLNEMATTLNKVCDAVSYTNVLLGKPHHYHTMSRRWRS